MCFEELLQSMSGPASCSWNRWTCSGGWLARGEQLKVLKWARAQYTAVPFVQTREWKEHASWSGHRHIVVKWIDQQEEESDEEYGDGD